jgi:hypothetical protein
VAAVASWLRGGKYYHVEDAQVEVTELGEPSPLPSPLLAGDEEPEPASAAR